MNIENIDKLGPLKSELEDVNLWLAFLQGVEVKHMTLRISTDQQLSLGIVRYGEFLQEVGKDLVNHLLLRKNALIKEIEAL